MKGTIGKRILLGFGLIIVLSAILGIYTLSQMSRVRSMAGEISKDDFGVQQRLREIDLASLKIRIVRAEAINRAMERRLGLPGEAAVDFQAQWNRLFRQLEDLFEQLDATLADQERSGVSPERRSQWTKVRRQSGANRDLLEQLRVDGESVFEALARGEWAQLEARRAELDRQRQTFDAGVNSMVGLVRDNVDLGQSQILDVFNNAYTSAYGVLLLVVIIGIVSTVVIQRSITIPLAAFMQFVERVGTGDLTQQADATRGDELGKLGQSLNEMVSGLRDMALQTSAVTESLNSAAAEILASTQQQAAGTGEQAAAVQQTTATVEEISQSGAQISSRAKQVAAAAEATSAAGSSGLQAVQETNRTMDSIREQAEAVAETVVILSEKTQAVGEIIAAVNDIAEQSNLLALNAAIEAAAAGEQGRSFSVVAGEMKNLAEQSKQATVQVRTILEDIQKGINNSVMLTEEAVKRVESGKRQADVGERTIREMSGSLQESIQAFQQILGATNQQQIGLEQVTQALKDIRQASEQTAVSTSQLEKAAANLNALGQQLRKAMERYRR